MNEEETKKTYKRERKSYLFPVQASHCNVNTINRFFVDLTQAFVHINDELKTLNKGCGKYDRYTITDIDLKIPKKVYNTLIKYIQRQKQYGKSIIPNGFMIYVTDSFDLCYIPQQLEYKKGLKIIIINDDVDVANDTYEHNEIDWYVEHKYDL